MQRSLPPLGLVRMNDGLFIWPAIGHRLARGHFIPRTDADERRQRRQKRVEALIGMQVAADVTIRLARSTVAHHGDMIRRRSGIDVLHRYRRQSEVAGHDVLISAWKHDHVAHFDLYSREVAAAHPTSAADDHMERGNRPRGKAEP